MDKKDKRSEQISFLEYDKKSITMQEAHYCYILQCSDGTYYTGWTNNLNKRVQAHQEGRGAKYTKGRTPVRVVHYEVFSSKKEAMRREYEIKQFTRKEKQQLIAKQLCKNTNK